MRTASLIFAIALFMQCGSGLPGAQHAHAADKPITVAPAKVADLSSLWIQRLNSVDQWLTREEQLSRGSREVLGGIIAEVSRDANAALARDEKLFGPLNKELQSLGTAPIAGVSLHLFHLP